MSMHNSSAALNPIKGKTVVITGASSGVGRAAAIEFARQGSRLVLAARRLPALNELVTECNELGASAIAVQTDVTDPAAMSDLAAKANAFGGQINVWINNAGVLAAGGFTDTPLAVHEQVIKANLLGYIYGAYAVIPFFKKQKSGILINNISIGGYYPTPFAVAYSASKFGLRGFSEALKAELSDWSDIHVCEVYPAFLDTPGIQHAGNYSGVLLKPAPPVYDPQRVGRAMVRLAKNPRHSVTVGGVVYLLRLGYFFMPAMMRAITAKIMKGYFQHGTPTPVSSGNLFAPLEHGTSIHGGWDTATVTKKRIKTSLLIGGIAASFIILKKLQKSK